MKPVKKKSSDVTVVLKQPTISVESQREVTSVEGLIETGIKSNVPIETLERLLAMRDKLKADQARGAFVHAMATFQANCPIIQKNKKVFEKNSTTQVRYTYASLDSIVSQVKEVLGKSQLAYTTTVVNEEGFITAVCKITHIMGHSEESAFKIPIGKGEYMSAPQTYASALTFAKRYAFCNALGILTGEDDFDAGDVGKKTELSTIVSTKGKIMFLLKELGINTQTATFDPVKEIKDLTQLDALNEDIKNLNDIKGRLEILVQEKRDASA